MINEYIVRWTALTIWTIRARHLLSHVLNTGSGVIDIFEVKLTFELLTMRGQQHSFSTRERMFLWKCQSFWDRKCLDLRWSKVNIWTVYCARTSLSINYITQYQWVNNDPVCNGIINWIVPFLSLCILDPFLNFTHYFRWLNAKET